MFAFFYLILMFIAILILGFSKEKNKIKIWIIAILFGFLAMMMVPRIGSNLDIGRYYSDLNTIRFYRKGTNLLSAFSFVNNYNNFFSVSNGYYSVTQDISYGSVPVMGFLMVLFSFLANNWLAFFVGFSDIFFSISLLNYVSTQYKSRKGLVIGSILFFTIFIFIAAVTGVRTNLVLSIFIYTYYVYISKKKQVWDIVIISLISLLIIFIHPIILLMVSFAILAHFFKGKSALFINLIMLLENLFQSSVFFLISKFSFIPFFSAISYKATQYSGGTATILAGSNMQILRSILRLAFFVIILLISKYSVKDSIIPNEYKRFVNILVFFTIGSFGNQILFERLVDSLLWAVLPNFVEVAIWNFKNKKTLKLSIICLIVLFSTCSLIDNLRSGVTYTEISLKN